MAKKNTTFKRTKVKRGKQSPSWKEHRDTTLVTGEKIRLDRAGIMAGTAQLKVRDLRDDPELGPTPKDAASKHKYPPPRKHPLFRKKWLSFVEVLSKRKDFDPSHLDALEVLCGLLVDEDDLGSFMRRHGHTYKSISRFGETWKMYPEAEHLSKVRTQIEKYMSRLSLFPKKLGKGLAEVGSEDESEEEKGWD